MAHFTWPNFVLIQPGHTSEGYDIQSELVQANHCDKRKLRIKRFLYSNVIADALSRD